MTFSDKFLERFRDSAVGRWVLKRAVDDGNRGPQVEILLEPVVDHVPEETDQARKWAINLWLNEGDPSWLPCQLVEAGVDQIIEAMQDEVNQDIREGCENHRDLMCLMADSYRW